MRDLLVVVLELQGEGVRAALAEVDRPGEVVRTVDLRRGAGRADDVCAGLAADVRSVLASLDVAGLAPRLLALAVVVHPDVPDDEATGLVAALTGGGGELLPGWPLPAALPVRAGPSAAWAAAGAGAPVQPLLAGAVVTAARSVGAHAHLPHP